MEYFTQLKTGIQHRSKEMMCQDHIGVKIDEHSNRLCMALTDGRGSTDANARAMEKVVAFLQTFLLTYYTDIFFSDDAKVSYNLLFELDNLLEEEAQKWKVPKSELASTLMAVAIDFTDQSYCTIHLGDGLIAIQEKNGRAKMLSNPLNGKAEEETILSTSEYALKYIKIHRSKINQLQKILLLSDGVYEKKMYIDSVIRNLMTSPYDSAILKEKIDDQAIGIIDLGTEECYDVQHFL